MALTTDDRVLERRLIDACDRIERMEKRLTPLLELEADLQPIAKEAFATLVVELDELDGHFETADALRLLKRVLRDTRTLTRMLERLEQVDELVSDLTPIVGEATQAAITELGEMERQGLFRTLGALRTVAARFSGRYTPDRVEQIGEGLVDLVAVLETTTSPQVQRILNAAVGAAADERSVPSSIGTFGLLRMMGDEDTRRGMALLLEVCRAVGRAAVEQDPGLLPSGR